MHEEIAAQESEPLVYVAPEPRPATFLARRCAVEMVLARMRENPGAPLRLGEMAELARVSRFHFNHLFRQVTGLSPRQFQTALRLREAARLLLRGRSSVTRICFDLGYESLGSFVTRFTQTFGLPPRRLRRWSALLEQPLGRLLPGAPAAADSAGPVGELDSGGFSGLIFLGLFRQRLPAAPAACMLLHGSGAFSLPSPPDGRYYPMAVGLPAGRPAIDLLLGDDLPRGASQSSFPWRAASPARLPPISLRPPETIDPPINFHLSALLRLAGASP
jgi:AraC family transcriptional regulator